jgi:hypothetical protein
MIMPERIQAVVPSVQNSETICQTQEATSLSNKGNLKILPPNETNYLVGWDENDKLNPRNLPMARKWLIVLIISLGSMLVLASPKQSKTFTF